LPRGAVETDEMCPWIVEPTAIARLVPMYTGSTTLAVIGSPALVMRRPLSSLHRRSLPDLTTIVLGEGCASCATASDIDAVKTENEKSIPVMWDFIVHFM
jgi:hypothetical protein